MKTLFLTCGALVIFSVNATALVGETEAELLKRYGKPTSSKGTGGGFGKHFWQQGTAGSLAAKLVDGKCVEEEMTEVDEAAINRIMRMYPKKGQTWKGSTSFFQPNETRTLFLIGEDVPKGAVPTVKITRDGKKIEYRAIFTRE